MKKQEKEAVKKHFKERIDDFRKKALAVQEAVCELRATGLNEHVIYFAIQRASQKHNTSMSPIGVGDIKAIMQGLEGIEGYLFPEE